MKRSSTQSSTGSGNGYAGGYSKSGNNNNNYTSKKSKVESFEDDLDGEYMSTQRIDIEEDQGKIESESRAKWLRPAPECWNAKEKNLLFHWLDIDMTSGQPLLDNPDGSGIVYGSSDGPVPVVRMYGVTQDGLSVLCNVHGFTPYFYVQLAGMTDISEESIGALRMTLDQRVSCIS
jgi:hypothetical protein